MQQPSSNKQLTLKLVLLVFGMFGFGFALIPLYEVFCDLTGINGKTSDTAATYDDVIIDTSRKVTVEFITRNQGGMPWEFKSEIKRVQVHPGEINTVTFYARNPSSDFIVGQAVPSVAPGTAALYLHKTECFCFDQQSLSAGEDIEMPMQFYVDPQLPEDIEFFTLSYTLFDVTDKTALTMNTQN